MYRWDHVAEKMFIRRYGKAESPVSVPHDNELVNEALLYGDEISMSLAMSKREPTVRSWLAMLARL
jgi:hypothetical protein